MKHKQFKRAISKENNKEYIILNETKKEVQVVDFFSFANPNREIQLAMWHSKDRYIIKE